MDVAFNESEEQTTLNLTTINLTDDITNIFLNPHLVAVSQVRSWKSNFIFHILKYPIFRSNFGATEWSSQPLVVLEFSATFISFPDWLWNAPLGTLSTILWMNPIRFNIDRTPAWIAKLCFQHLLQWGPVDGYPRLDWPAVAGGVGTSQEPARLCWTSLGWPTVSHPHVLSHPAGERHSNLLLLYVPHFCWREIFTNSEYKHQWQGRYQSVLSQIGKKWKSVIKRIYIKRNQVLTCQSVFVCQ